MTEKILITAALPYANGAIHFGHIAGAYLPADCCARFQRLKKNDVLYICGSDEYGIAIVLSAEMANRTPKEHVDIFHEKNKALFEKFAISFDHYSRTTTSIHTKVVQDFFLQLYENGYIEEKVEDHLFSEKENRFLADRYVVGICPRCGFNQARGDECQKCAASYEATDLKNPRSKLTGSPLILKPSKHWYLRFDMFKEKLTNWIEQKKWKQNVLNFAKEYIKDLKPRAISRDSAWGVAVPLKEAKDKVLYVWFDAPIGYISATIEWARKINQPDKWESYWMDKSTKLINFIGKDNIPFHAVFFPAMIMGLSKPYKLVDELPANEFLMLEKRRFSKSDKWYVDLDEFFKYFTCDQIRFYLASIAPENHDSDFMWKDFQVCCNSELVGKFGNFIYRSLTFVNRFAGGKIPKCHKLDEVDKKFLSDIKFNINEIEKAYNEFKLRRASQIIMELASVGNVYFDLKKPWVLAKDKNKANELSCALNLCVKCIKALALISFPVIPDAAQKAWEMIGFKTQLSKENWEDVSLLEIHEEKSIPEPCVIFNKAEDELIDIQIKKLKGDKMEDENLPMLVPLKEEISFKDFDKIDMRVGLITQAHKIEKSEKLLRLEVDLGFEKRQVISGIAKSISPDKLIGKKVIVVANLKTARLMGFESSGMIVCAGQGEDSQEIPFILDKEKGDIVC